MGYAFFEYSKPISIERLPKSWQDKKELEKLRQFLNQNWKLRKSFYDDGEFDSEQQFIKFLDNDYIQTNKYIGTIVFNNEQIDIIPRVFKNIKDNYDDNDESIVDTKFLLNNVVYWLNYSKKKEFPFLQNNSDISHYDNFKDLFILIFLWQLKKCIKRGEFFQFKDKTDDISYIKGKFDIADFYSKKYSNGIITKFRCEYTAFEFDNLLNRIIKFTLKKMFAESCDLNKKEIRKLLTKFSDVADVRCLVSDCDKVKINKINSSYKTILNLCKIYLLNMNLNYMSGKADSFCFLFPTYVLFERFIAGYMEEYLSNKQHCVQTQLKCQHLIDEIVYKDETKKEELFQLIPDIVIDDKYILDTKYKEIPTFNPFDINKRKRNVSQKDMYQIFSYLVNTQKATKGFLLYPLSIGEEIEFNFPKLINNKCNCGGGPIEIQIVKMPFVVEDNIETFEEQMNNCIEALSIK